jgi:hypothetical protein
MGDDMDKNLSTLRHNKQKPNHFFQITGEMLHALDAFFYRDDPLNPNLNHDVGSLDYLNQRNPQPIVLHALIAIILCKNQYTPPINPEKMHTLDLNDQSILCDTATHIATRIKELILGQGISAEDFSSLVYAGRPDDESLSQCTEEQLSIIVSKQFESINENFQPTQPQEGLPIERKLQNLLEKTEFLDLVGILTHLTPYTPNNDTAHVMLDFLVMALSSLDFQQPPLETETTPTPIQRTVLLPSLNHQRTA